MHVNFEVVDIAGFFAFFAQARQSRSSEVTGKPERCYWVQFRPGEKVVSPRRGYNRPGENDPGEMCSLDCFCPSEIIFAQARGFSLKLDFRPS